MAKGTKRLAYKNTLLAIKVHSLRAANQALSKRRHAKKTRIRQGGVLTGEEVQDILAQEEANAQIQRDEHEMRGRSKEGQPAVQQCGTCGETGHNARTCQVEVDRSSSLEFN